MVTLQGYTKFDNTGSHKNREICDGIFDWREKNGQKKKKKKEREENDKQQKADSLLHNKQVILNICTKFLNPRHSSS